MYIPHTDTDRKAMLEKIGVASIDALFDPIPEPFRLNRPLDIGPALSELELAQHMGQLARHNRGAESAVCFLGGGCYDHFIPAVVDTVASRSEYYTAYTPYQAEASQGTLQTGFEFQTLMSQLTSLPVSNASLYEAATGVVEAVLLARATTKRFGKVVFTASVHPEYRQTVKTYLASFPTTIVELQPSSTGQVDLDQVAAAIDDQTACVVVQSPNFFGIIEPVAEIAAMAKKQGAVVVQAFDPISLGLLTRPGDLGADIAVAEGQSLGSPMAYGGPFLGIFTCREEFVRKIPGRIVGETVDRQGKRCFVLTLQTREQHIRRDKATSNICSNQGLLALRASVYLSLLGPQGLRETAELCFQKAAYAADALESIGLKRRFTGPFFKEFVIDLPGPASNYLPALLDRGYHAGVALGAWYPEATNALLVAVTEKRSKAEIDGYVNAWKEVLG